VELVLGVSMTPATVRIALVEGEKADGVIVDHDVFDLNAVDGAATPRASDEVIATVLGTQEGAIAAGHHLVSTGVTWTDRAEAAVLREALVARGIEGVLLVSELHAAAALAQAVGRAVGYDKTGLMFVERETATLAVVETEDGSVVKVVSESLHGGDAIAAVAELVSDPSVQESVAQGLFVVGSGIDVTAVKAHLTDLVAVPVIAPEEPQLALARGAALASANAPRYDAATVGLAYSQDPDGTTAHSILVADLLDHDDESSDAADIAPDPDDVPERSKPFLLVGSSMTAIFVAGMMALTIAVAVTVRPTAGQGTDVMPAAPGTAAPPLAVPSAPPNAAKQVPTTVPAPAPAAPPPARIAQAQLKDLPAPPPPRVVVRNVAPAPAAPPPPAPVAPPPPVVVPPPFVAPPVIPPPIIQWPAPWVPPILQPPRYYNPPQVRSPAWYPNPSWPRRGGHGGGHKGHGGD
jgi:hypothetical protein